MPRVLAVTRCHKSSMTRWPYTVKGYLPDLVHDYACGRRPSVPLRDAYGPHIHPELPLSTSLPMHNHPPRRISLPRSDDRTRRAERLVPSPSWRDSRRPRGPTPTTYGGTSTRTRANLNATHRAAREVLRGRTSRGSPGSSAAVEWAPGTPRCSRSAAGPVRSGSTSRPLLPRPAAHAHRPVRRAWWRRPRAAVAPLREHRARRRSRRATRRTCRSPTGPSTSSWRTTCSTTCPIRARAVAEFARVLRAERRC